MTMPLMPLENTIQNYVWGSNVYLAELLGESTPAAAPQAEMWMGAHPKAPSKAGGRSLVEVIAEDPAGVLGTEVAARYGNRLPFLLKLLAAGTPLSLQAHPNLEQAREGFARENAAGIPLSAPHRNYKDENHKPEIICALSEFWGLNGFRPIPEILELLGLVPLPSLQTEIQTFHRSPNTSGLRTFFRTVMELPGSRRQELSADLLTWAKTHAERDEARWLSRGKEVFGDDVGLLAILLLNLVKLAPGEAMYCAAGDLHAYLDGFGVELMANSDNVLRGGCTVKHVDVPELMRVLTFADRPAQIIRPDSAGVYATPAPEFELSVIRAKGTPMAAAAGHGPEILVCVSGSLKLEGAGGPLALRPGHSVFVPAAAGSYTLAGSGTAYRAGVGRS